MRSERISAFSDGVIAIIITIMVLELKKPTGPDWSALLDLKFDFLVYAVSFFCIAIYWNNHHHMFQLMKQVTGRIMWENMLLLFLFSLIPFATSWMAAYPLNQAPELAFGILILAIRFAYTALAGEIYKQQDFVASYRKSLWYKKAFWSGILVIIGPLISLIFNINLIVMLFAVISLTPWVIPDKEIEKNLNGTNES